MNRPGPATPARKVFEVFSGALARGWIIRGTHVVQLEQPLADAILQALPQPGMDVTLDGVLEWLDAAPEDWPSTGADIATLIRQGCPAWRSTDAMERIDQTPTVKDVLYWLECVDDFTDLNGDDQALDPIGVAKLIRAHFELPEELPPSPPETTLELWAKRGLFPGDMINEDGDMLTATGMPFGSGVMWVTKEQAARAAVFGWMLHDGLLPSHDKPDLVAVRR